MKRQENSDRWSSRIAAARVGNGYENEITVVSNNSGCGCRDAAGRGSDGYRWNGSVIVPLIDDIDAADLAGCGGAVEVRAGDVFQRS